jgi:hypothetical protein
VARHHCSPHVGPLPFPRNGLNLKKLKEGWLLPVQEEQERLEEEEERAEAAEGLEEGSAVEPR